MRPRLRLKPETMGVGLTSQRVRDRLLERLRAGVGGSDAISDERVLAAMGRVPRHLFVDEMLASRAYEDNALPIGHGQTISQPWVVAKMSEAILRVNPKRVLEIGTGSGYQAAILAALGLEVYTVERIGELLRAARRRFRTLGLSALRSKHDDGHLGWAEHAPFDAIIVTAGAPALVPALMEQLVTGGLLVAPVGVGSQQTLVQLQRHKDGTFAQQALAPVVFVPLLPGVLE